MNNSEYRSAIKEKKHLRKVNRRLSYYERFKLAFESDVDIDPGRLMGLTDGIFGMVMTLLVFGIALPELQIASYSDFISFISTLTPTVGVTIVSFVLISSFWIYHHEFIKIKRLNIPYLWINILFLICISFIPFSTSLIGNYSHFFLSETLFGLNIFLTIVFFLLMYYYADSRRFFEEMPSKSEKRHIINTLLIIMGLTVVVNLLDFNVSRNFIYLFLLVPVISTLRDIHYRM
ncbi:TMEM175 family protein [uncultured Methanobrevibacter sp.]|uniref:TMEM175 family protein n=1 Tax=uncultured Methanobrevibacter sp. TaxID=253161 RepID=UPI00260CB257|nr:TMEM175 family protein [uncultured Methanobrevibacter sp.]